MATVNLGKIKLKWRGTYAGGTAYTPDDVVYYMDGSVGSSYICVTATTGNAPSSGGTAHASWNYLAKGQATSPTTNQGDIIVRGVSADERLAIGSAGHALKVNASANGLEYGDVSAGLSSIQVFDTAGSHTWTKPTGIKKVKVIVTGGGGGGFGYRVGNDAAPSTGGAGGTAIELIDVSSVSSVAVTVGAGGAGNQGTAGGASNGSTSSFGSYCSATGGEGGSNGNNDYRHGGIGGVGSGGDINLTGGSGTSGNYSTDSNPNPTSTVGGASFWGGAGGSMAQAVHGSYTNTRIDGKNGGGGAGTANSSSSVGGDGGAGVVYVEEYK